MRVSYNNQNYYAKIPLYLVMVIGMKVLRNHVSAKNQLHYDPTYKTS